ncbi:MAG: glycosyltransferase [Nitrososphaerota archaeon]|nr:glycosyltransferase [Nitrososphaerota archaeon]
MVNTDIVLPLVSVVVVTKNEEKNIATCLQSVKNQTYHNIELIVVDNFSEDQTVEIAKKYTANIYSKGNERSAQKNYGANVAAGKYVLYVDADMILNPNLISDCKRKCETEQKDALYVPEKIIGKGFWIKVRDFERGFYNGTVVDAVRFVRKDLFVDVGGFDESLVGPEDWDLDRKVRLIGAVGISDVGLCHNEGVFHIKRYLEKKKYYIEGIQKYIEKWGANDSQIAKQVGLSYRMFGVFTEDGKWRTLFKHPVLLIGLYFLRFRVAITYFGTKLDGE